MASKEIVDRLACAKYIFLHGLQVLESEDPYCDGLAVLSFHDSVEMVLRAAAEHRHLEIKNHTHFMGIIDALNEDGESKITHRSALIQLNQARVSFKHQGLNPQVKDVKKFRNDLEGFFPIFISNFLDIEYESLSLTNLIRHRRTKNWAERAEKALNESNVEEALKCCAVAYAIFTAAYSNPESHSPLDSELRHSRVQRDHDAVIPDAILQMVRAIDSRFDELSREMMLISSGIAKDRHERFMRLTPDVQLAVAGNFSIQSKWGPEPSNGDALFCCQFLVSTVLALEQHYQPDRFWRLPLKRRFKVLKASPVIVWPVSEKSRGIEQETIWTPKEGVELIGFYENHDQPGYRAILQDGECAYIADDAVEQIE